MQHNYCRLLVALFVALFIALFVNYIWNFVEFLHRDMSPSIVPRGIYQNTSGLCEIKNYYVTKSIWKGITSAQKDGRIATDGPL